MTLYYRFLRFGPLRSPPVEMTKAQIIITIGFIYISLVENTHKKNDKMKDWGIKGYACPIGSTFFNETLTAWAKICPSYRLRAE